LAEGDDIELTAMKTVLDSLQSLDSEARGRVLKYVFDRLGITSPIGERGPGAGHVPPKEPQLQRLADIRSLKEEKQPKSNNQMAALVGYYLSELAPAGERKEVIGDADIGKYFKQAGFKLPQRPDATLANARNAGYFDHAGEGVYRLNPVGYNLVVHGLPREQVTPSLKKARKKARSKKRG
jgi:hypothetical protein